MAPRRSARGAAIWTLVAVGWAMAMVGVPLPARALPPTPEYEVKAAFLYNFMQFVEWPETAFAAAEAPVCIGVLGDDPFGSALEEIVRGETVGDRPLVVHRSREVTDLIECQVVFISKSEEGRMPALLDALEPRPVLTVGEVAGFARSGGIINFYLEESRVRFEINAKVAQRQGLRMSSQLLNLGRIVESG